jgi:diamine N-acetyltransferase
MSITLHPITKTNWRLVYMLTKTLTDEQRHFVADNGFSMLEALYDSEHFTAYAIYSDETPVGFLMIGNDPDTGDHWIVRLMIGGEHQGKGYGRAAMHLALDLFKAMPGCDAVYIGFEPNNQVARRLYESVGFQDTGRIEYGELVFRLPLTEPEVS